MSHRLVFRSLIWIVLLSIALSACGGPSAVPSPESSAGAPTSGGNPVTSPTGEEPLSGGATPGTLQITFTADRTQIAPGECATLQWQVSGPHFVVVLEEEEVPDQGSKQVCPPENRPFFLRVDTGETMEERMVTIAVGGEPGTASPPPDGSENPPPAGGKPSPEVSPSGPGTYRYDFENDASGWDLNPAWSRVALDTGGYALRGVGEGSAALTAAQGPISYVRYRFSEDAIGDTLNATLFTSQERYTLEIGGRGVCYFSLSLTEAAEEQCIYGHYPILPRQFYTVEIYVNDDSLDIFINGEGVVGVDLPTPIAPERTLSFEVFSDSNHGVTVDDVEIRVGDAIQPPAKARSPYSWQPGADVGPFVNGVAREAITLDGNESLTLQGGRYMAYGDITLKGNAGLIIEADAALYISDIFLFDNATLTMNGGYLLPLGAVASPQSPESATLTDLLGAVYAADSSVVSISNAKVDIHFIDVSGHARLNLKDSRFYTSGGGMVTPYGAGTIYAENSTLGAITLAIPPGATFKAHGLKPGHFDSLNLIQDMDISGVDYNLVLNNVDIVADTLPTGHASDASERGWELEVNEGAQVELTDSELRKLTFQILPSGDPLTFQNLAVGQPMNTTVGPVTLKNTTVRGQWGFYIHGNRQVTIEDSDGIWPLPYDTSQVTVKNSRMNEFDPRQYSGVITFEHTRWYGPGEIIMDCDFLMLGTLEMNVPSLAWIDSTVTREYLFQVRDAAGNPLPGVVLTLQRDGETLTATTDAQGEARLRLKFTPENYTQSWTLTTDHGQSQEIGFFTTTPVVVSP